MPANAYKENLDIPLLPLDESAAAILARDFAAKIADAGGREPAARAAANAVLARRADEPPDEQLRLQLLYARVYTRDELQRLMRSLFDRLGLGD